MYCYLVKVTSTNGLQDKWRFGKVYLTCAHGEVYIYAETLEQAARFVGDAAKSITKVGPAYIAVESRLAELEGE